MQEMVTYFVGLARENNNTFPAGKYEAYSIYNYAPVYTARVDPDNASCTTLTTHLKLSSLALYIHTHTHAHPGNNLTIGLFVRYTKRVDTLASLSTTSPTTVLDQTCIATHLLLSLTLPCLPSFSPQRVSPLTRFSLSPSHHSALFSPVSHLLLPCARGADIFFQELKRERSAASSASTKHRQARNHARPSRVVRRLPRWCYCFSQPMQANPFKTHDVCQECVG